VASARDGFWGCHCLALFHLAAKIFHVGANVDELACTGLQTVADRHEYRAFYRYCSVPSHRIG
jgi:hypothetical protein